MMLIAIFLIASSIQAQHSETKYGKLKVVDAKLGKDVINRIIVDESSTFDVNSKVFLWLKVIGGVSETITVTWKSGELIHSTQLPINGSPWRTWANKTVFKAGDWAVTVTDIDGNILKEINFKVQ